MWCGAGVGAQPESSAVTRDDFPGERHRAPLSVPAVFRLMASSLPAAVLTRGLTHGFGPLCGYTIWKFLPVAHLRLYRDRGYGE